MPPSVVPWWKTTEMYKGGSSNLVIGKQVFCGFKGLWPIGRKTSHLLVLADGKDNGLRAINVVLTAKDVAVYEFFRVRAL
ncbi:hypothetical protein G4B88_030564 [Cannabis sativa]|uniref:Uncharacterized protein n=1 Tax=Cannabis sativa TaxID=3483 RepID=A0A7J6DMA7_CANSA|nr:hypothetical protein G4B88_030564 [Cannabis sativa]